MSAINALTAFDFLLPILSGTKQPSIVAPFIEDTSSDFKGTKSFNNASTLTD